MIKRLAQCIREYKKSTILTPLTVSLEVLMEVIIPLYMADLIDFGIDLGDMDFVIRTGIVLIIMCLMSLSFGALSGHFAAQASAGFSKNLRHDMFYNVQKFSFSNIDKFSTGSIITRLTTDVTNVQMAFQMIIRIAVRSPIMLIFSAVMAFRINAEVSRIILCAIPVLGIGLYLIMSNAHPIFKRVFKTYDDLNNVVQEDLSGIRVVKSFVREDYETIKFKDVSGSIFNDFTKAEKLLSFNSPLMQLSLYGCMLGISWFGARIIITSGSTVMTTGQLMSIITYTMQILMSLMMVSMIIVMITISRASAERIYELLEEKSNIVNNDAPIFEIANGDVEFKNVSFNYYKNADKKVLDNINFSVKSGQTVGIIGGTGSSKSSLVQLIPRLYDVSEGKISVAGIDVREYDLETLRNSVAMVLQKNVLFSGTIKDNLRWGNPDATDEEMIEACRLAQADSFINSFPDKYDTYIEQGGTNVSGGQKQRLCIARALLKNPKIIIMDDSTSAVDTATDALIQKAFTESIPGITKIVIAQRVSSISSSDMIIVLDDGKISGIGTHDELLQTNDIYREIYEEQTKKGGDNNE